MPEPLFYELYDSIFASKDYRSEVARALHAGNVSPPGKILDLGCGTGNHSLACAELGFDVTGVDVDEHMIAAARRKVPAGGSHAGGKVLFMHGSIEDVAFEEFDLALSLFNVVNYLPSIRDVQAFMYGVAKRLRPGAAFVFDAWNGVAALCSPPQGKSTENGRVSVRLDCETDPMDLACLLRYRIESADGRRAEHSMRHSLWPSRVLREAGARCRARSGFGFAALGRTP